MAGDADGEFAEGVHCRGVYSVETNEIIPLSRGNCKLISPSQKIAQDNRASAAHSDGVNNSAKSGNAVKNSAHRKKLSGCMELPSPLLPLQILAQRVQKRRALLQLSNLYKLIRLCACAMSPGPASADGIPAC